MDRDLQSNKQFSRIQALCYTHFSLTVGRPCCAVRLRLVPSPPSHGSRLLTAFHTSEPRAPAPLSMFD
jgi:hypothetical protein